MQLMVAYVLVTCYRRLQISEEGSECYAEEHREGWVEFLDRLAVLVAKRRL